MQLDYPLPRRIGQTAFAFRGYNLTNLGRTAELLAHPAFGPVVAGCLAEASDIASDILGSGVNLAERVRSGVESVPLETYGEDVALILAVEMAQLRLLEEFFGAPLAKAKMAFGYSLGEISALIASGVYQLRDMLPVLLLLSDDAIELARDVKMGVLFSRGAALDQGVVKRLCQEVSQEGKGLIDISARLSPNSVLLLGQNQTVASFQKKMRSLLPGTQLRTKNANWPPMHTIIVRLRAIPSRAAVLLDTAPGGFQAPSVRLLSGVTGKASYTDSNSRDLLYRWTDYPQQLWSMVHETLIAGVEAVVHVGPEPNIIPATFKRLSEDVRGQTNGYSPSRLGLRAMSQLVKRPWLSQLLPSATALLRAPFIQHINLEDWLLAQPLK